MSEINRAITRMLDEGSQEYHTFKLTENVEGCPSGISQMITTGKTKQNLTGNRRVAKFRMYKKTEGVRNDMPLILAQLAKTAGNKNIFN